MGMDSIHFKLVGCYEVDQVIILALHGIKVLSSGYSTSKCALAYVLLES